METASKKLLKKADSLTSFISGDLLKAELSLSTLLKNYLRNWVSPPTSLRHFKEHMAVCSGAKENQDFRKFQYALQSALIVLEITLSCLRASRFTRVSLDSSAEVKKLTDLMARMKEYQSKLDDTLLDLECPASGGSYNASQAANYQEWISYQRGVFPENPNFTWKPKLSIILPVYNPPLELLVEAIESVKNQDYDNWELCISDDASTKRGIHELLQSFANADKRIKLVLRETNGHISASTNSGLEMATGDFVLFFDHDDKLADQALSKVAFAINRYPQAKLFYSDEDKIDIQGHRYSPYFKPDWSLEMLRAQNYLCHLCIYDRDLVEKVGKLRVGFEGSQDWDLALRVVEQLADSQIVHIPDILYHWRVFAGSASLAVTQKSYTVTAAQKALEEHIQRTGCSATLEMVKGYNWRFVYPVPASLPKVSIIIPTKDKFEYIQRCIQSLLKLTTYKNYEILLIDNASEEACCKEWFASLAETESQVKVLSYPKAFNYSAINNYAVSQATGEILVLLNNDTEIIQENWLEELVAQTSRPEVGCVGALLLYPNNRIQHAGVLMGVGSVAGHAFVNNSQTSSGYFNRLCFASEYDAVTAACLAVRRSVYLEVGGLNETDLPVAFNDVDFCLRVSEAGYRNLFTPFSRLHHYESLSRGKELKPEEKDRAMREVKYMQTRWEARLKHSRFYNPNLSLEPHLTFQIASPPRPFKWYNLPTVSMEG